jgi:hypothetical protein
MFQAIRLQDQSLTSSMGAEGIPILTQTSAPLVNETISIASPEPSEPVMILDIAIPLNSIGCGCH